MPEGVSTSVDDPLTWLLLLFELGRQKAAEGKSVKEQAERLWACVP
jgi:hypothetical protein